MKRRSRLESRNPEARTLIVWTAESFAAHVVSSTAGEYEPVSEFVRAKVHVDMLHVTCGNIYKVTPDNFLRNRSRCPKCSTSAVKSNEDFLEEVSRLVGDQYTVISPYINAKTQITFRHEECGHEYLAEPSTFLKGHRCPQCAVQRKRKGAAQFASEIERLVGDEYSVIGDYVNNRTFIDLRHARCGEVYRVRPSNFLMGDRCRRCSESKGERAIREFLLERSIPFSPQFRISDCRNLRPLPFDFAVHLTEGDVLVEYDGRQHFEPVSFGGDATRTLRDFERTQRTDRIKTAYCLANGIMLIRIKHTQINEIARILTEALHLPVDKEVFAA